MSNLEKEATVPRHFEIRHFTEIKRGNLGGHFQVGLSLASDGINSVGWERAS